MSKLKTELQEIYNKYCITDASLEAPPEACDVIQDALEPIEGDSAVHHVRTSRPIERCRLKNGDKMMLQKVQASRLFRAGCSELVVQSSQSFQVVAVFGCVFGNSNAT